LIDLGAGHASAAETMSARTLTALKSEGLLNESVGAGYIERNWPEALRESGAWPLQGLRQSFVNGALTRLRDPEETLRTGIAQFVAKGDSGVASGQRPNGTYERVWFKEPVGSEEVVFEPQVFLLRREHAAALKQPVVQLPTEPVGEKERGGVTTVTPSEGERAVVTGEEPVAAATSRIRLRGPIPPELWNRFGTRLLPKLRSGEGLSLTVEAQMEVPTADLANVQREIRQSLSDLGLAESVIVDAG